MDRDTIIQLARDAGISESHAQGLHGFLERFAALVAAAAVRETSAEYRMGWNDGQINEREAMVSEAAKQGWAMKNDDSFEDAVREIAAIRSRK